MIIQRITLNNIRSYRRPQPIELSTGVTLFEGDIGSGKSTLLSAIEFALFGLGDIAGTYLLRHGEKTGSVLLEFSVNSKPYKVYRSLKRKRKSVTQKEGYIVEDGQRTDYSVTEMKTRILKILSFNERPKPRTSSLIYRYAIFTPQEEMKEVLFQPVERRLETLRRAFRVEDYSTIAENTSIILNWIDREAEILKRQTKDIDEKRTSLQEEKTKVAKFKSELEILHSCLGSLQADRKEVAEKIEKLEDQKSEVIKLQAEIPHIQESLGRKANIIQETKASIDELKRELEDIENAEKLLSTFAPKYGELLSSKEKLEKLEPFVKELHQLNTEKEKLQTAIENEKKNIEKQIKSIQKDLDNTKEWLSEKKPETLEIPKLENEESDLLKKVEHLPSISESLVNLKQNRSALTQNIKGKKELQTQLKDELDDLEEIGIGAPCPKCKQKLTQKHYDKVQQDYVNEIEEIEGGISNLKKEKTELESEIKETSRKKKTFEDMNVKLNKIQQKLAGFRKQKEAVKEKEVEYEKNEQAINDLKKQLAEEKFIETERKRISEVKKLLEKLLPVQTEYDEIKRKIKVFEKDQIENKYHTKKEKISKKKQVKKDITEKQGKADSLQVQLEKEKQGLKEKMKNLESKKGVLDVIEGLQKKRKAVDEKIQKKIGEIIAKDNDIENSMQEYERISGEIETREEQLRKLDEIKQYELWLSDYFISAVKLIESHMLANINSEFNSLFQKWIIHLLEAGDIVVSVDEKFSPHIVQDGYDIDVKSLSGGEKTSVALAYRLALNVMVKKVCEAMQSNLLILDEPTDGFSREQLSRLRDILNELKCEQVIIVSHESELEGFVDNIFRVTKDSGESKILTG
ncbi:MAG: SMC family ATPase [Candidatus Bathyarchaeota archaeon]|nr:SMC family ATPase [Candidatus Bathyarchaeota archaeon]